ncbi:MAG: apolipoprotein N-acyltransferase [Deltaproteobacteria bacterium]|nr:apolipoprotein N-acyltransferase [Deltaproteobacteria bacterium]
MLRISKDILVKALLSVLSGLLIAFLFPDFNFEFLAWFALIPLLYVINKSGGFKESFFYGFIAGLVSYVVIMYWIVYTVHVFGNLPYYIAVFALLLLSAYLSLYIALFAGFSKILLNNYKRLGIILIPSCWVFFEFLKSNLLTGFPWENLGFSQYLNLSFIQISNIIGAFGLSFIIVLINYSIFHFIFFKNEMSKRQALFELILVLFVFISVILYGYYNVYSVGASLKNKKPLEVALIQGNIGMFQKWKITKKRTTRIYLNLTKESLKYKPKIVVWPETALPYIISFYPRYWSRVMDFVKKNNIDLVFGTIGARFFDGKYRYYNRDYMFGKSGEYSYYDKNHLVPFGEYVPLRHRFPFLAHILKGAGIGDFTPGKKFRILEAGKIKAGSMICYEAYFDSLVRNFSKDGANLLISITDDAWYGKTAAPYQDMSMTVFSAVENDRYVARAGNSGISGIISPDGRILEETNIFKRTFMEGYVRLINKKTFFALYGNIFAYVVMALFSLSLIYLIISYVFFNKSLKK